jgi:hypothetical protein
MEERVEMGGNVVASKYVHHELSQNGLFKENRMPMSAMLCKWFLSTK